MRTPRFVQLLVVVGLPVFATIAGAAYGADMPGITADAYVQFLFERDLTDRLVVNIDYLHIFGRSIVVAAITTAITLVVAFPMALWMAFQPPRRRLLLVFIVTIPFWTNILVRNYAWILLLRNDGVIDWVLGRLGLTGEHINVLYTPFATTIGLTYSFLPYMVLPIYVSLEKLDRRLIEAAFDLGANRWLAFRRVILPLSMPGVVGGAILVFVPGLGAFISPELLGGAKSMMIGSLIQQQFGQSRNWPFGAALSFVLLVLVLLALSAHAARYRREAKP